MRANRNSAPNGRPAIINRKEPVERLDVGLVNDRKGDLAKVQAGIESFERLMRKMGTMSNSTEEEIDFWGAKAWVEDFFLGAWGHPCSYGNPAGEGFVMAMAWLLALSSGGCAVERIHVDQVLKDFGLKERSHG